MTIDTPTSMLFLTAVSAVIAMLVALASYWRKRTRLLRHQVTVLAIELSDVREAHAAALRGVNAAVLENVRLRRQRPLILNGKMYCSSCPRRSIRTKDPLCAR